MEAKASAVANALWIAKAGTFSDHAYIGLRVSILVGLWPVTLGYKMSASRQR